MYLRDIESYISLRSPGVHHALGRRLNVHLDKSYGCASRCQENWGGNSRRWICTIERSRFGSCIGILNPLSPIIHIIRPTCMLASYDLRSAIFTIDSASWTSASAEIFLARHTSWWWRAASSKREASSAQCIFRGHSWRNLGRISEGTAKNMHQ
jgi:hypothetical protein